MKYPLAVFLLSPVLLGAAVSSNAASRKPVKSTAHPAASTKSKRGKHGKTAARKPAGPSFQTHPTEERYKEIQQALADKGYFKGEVNGEWKDDSVESLKRFQGEHQLYTDGKITAPSLAELGLGPNHETRGPAGAPASASPNP